MESALGQETRGCNSLGAKCLPNITACFQKTYLSTGARPIILEVSGLKRFSSSQVASNMAANVQIPVRESLPLRPTSAPQSMNKDFQIRFTAIVLALLTLAAVILAWINFQKDR